MDTTTITIKKQITTTLSQSSKTFIEDLQSEFVAPSLATGKDKPLTAEEAIALLISVATDHRFHYVTTGETDDDGLPEMKCIDRFDDAANAIFASRASVARAAKLERLKAQMAELQGY